MGNPIPVDIVELIKNILAHKERFTKEEAESSDEHLERAYIYDYVEEVEEEQDKEIQF